MTLLILGRVVQEPASAAENSLALVLWTALLGHSVDVSEKLPRSAHVASKRPTVVWPAVRVQNTHSDFPWRGVWRCSHCLPYPEASPSGWQVSHEASKVLLLPAHQIQGAGSLTIASISQMLLRQRARGWRSPGHIGDLCHARSTQTARGMERESVSWQQ